MTDQIHKELSAKEYLTTLLIAMGGYDAVSINRLKQELEEIKKGKIPTYE